MKSGGFVYIPIIVIILLIIGGATAYQITQKPSPISNINHSSQQEATSSTKEDSAGSETTKRTNQPTVSKSPFPKIANKPLASSTPTPATQTTIKTPAIQGTVLTNSGNNPVKGYTVYLRKYKDDGNSDVIATAVTDEKGIYTFENLQPGKYQTSGGFGQVNTASGDIQTTITSDTKIAKGMTIGSTIFDPVSYTPSSSVRIESISPNPTKYGDEVTIKGSGFGSSGQYIVFTNPSGFTSGAAVLNWSDTEIKAKIPPTKGENRVQVEGPGGIKSNIYILQVTSGQPYFASVSPSSLKIGGEFTITGNEFGNDSGSVNFYSPGNSSSAASTGTIHSWTNSEIKASVPNNITPNQEYGVQVIATDGRVSPFKYYQVGN